MEVKIIFDDGTLASRRSTPIDQTRQLNLIGEAIFGDGASSPAISQLANQVAKQLLRS